jgi:excisionase family DNA binding protein
MEFTTAQAAAALGLSEQTVRNHVLAGRLQARRHGFRALYRISEAQLRDFAHKYNYPVDETLVAHYLSEVTRLPSAAAATGHTPMHPQRGAG